MIITRVNGKLVRGTSVANIFSKLLKRPLHREKDKSLKMFDIQKMLLKNKYNK